MVENPEEVPQAARPIPEPALGALAIRVEAQNQWNNSLGVEYPLGLKDAIRDVTARRRRLIQQKR
ncbi:MAG: hypothetical protein F4123_10110, partial [Gemmatimonadetes bacterium]|nr:hypothetical protein [Gemmatimonadota bacterium]